MCLIIALLFAYPIEVKAQISYPNFPSCLNPNGTVKVSYDSGSHGVPGTSNSYTGKDIVYTNTDGNYTQCLCTTNGDGIQTNWWKTGSITEEEISYLKANNWIYVPDGSLWGLEKASYMAKNTSYSCNGKSENSNGNSSSSTVSNNSSTDGQVLGAATTRFGEVLGLATTGTLPLIATYLAVGLFLLVISRLLKK